MAMVNSQQSRRILDRIVGFSLSPLLWKYIAPNLSGGRVQSVCLKIIIEKEESIDKFSDAQFYKVKGHFQHQLVGMLNTKFEKKDLMIQFLNHCKTAQFQIKSIEKNVSERNPPPSYITSSIQQDAGLRFGMSSKKIMSTLQKLYENGLITYHRTDNVNLSAEFIQKIDDYVTEKYGAQYFKKHVYKSKVKCAQEAHEAIRPTNINTKSLDKDDYDAYEQKLYQLIWKRTIASQMSKAIYDVYKIHISISDCSYMFVISFEKLVFDGYKKIYEDFVSKKNNDDDQDEATLIEDESILEKIKEKGIIKYKKIEALEKYSQPPSRYSESTLIKKMEKLGIGRPSTYSNIINTLIERNYMKIENIEGKKQKIYNYILEKQEVKEEEGTVSVGSEKKKLLPSQLGKNTCSFLNEHFVDLMDYKFTSV
jgi:DNA topoisomerase-1